MSWEFVINVYYWAVIGLIAFAVISVYVAGLYGIALKESFTRTKELLQRWSDVAHRKELKVLISAGGIGGILVLLAFFAYLSNLVGDATAPKVARSFGSFGYARTQWSMDYEHTEWRDVRRDFRIVAGIDANKDRWEEAKVGLGRLEVRLARALMVLFVFLALAGILSLYPQAYLKRGIATIIIGVAGFLLATFVWCERQDKFVENLVASYVSIVECAEDKVPELPAHYPHPYKRPSRFGGNPAPLACRKEFSHG